MFVPRGWWHCVLNVEDTVAVTQNYVSDCNLAQVLHFLQTKGDQVPPAAHAAEFHSLIPPTGLRLQPRTASSPDVC
jgi:hypothetical protein